MGEDICHIYNKGHLRRPTNQKNGQTARGKISRQKALHVHPTGAETHLFTGVSGHWSSASASAGGGVSVNTRPL